MLDYVRCKPCAAASSTLHQKQAINMVPVSRDEIDMLFISGISWLQMVGLDGKKIWSKCSRIANGLH
jgi:hypothetical protein